MINKNKIYNNISYFITIEGGEASGKSTQAKIIQKKLEKAGHSVLLTKEPGGSVIGEKIRNLFLGEEINDPLTEMMLISAARHENIKKIKNSLSKGMIIISDRYIDSSKVYQGIVKGLDKELISTLIKFSTNSLLPNITILLDTPTPIVMTRINNSIKHSNRYDNANYEFHEKVRKAFLELASSDPNRIKIIDGSLSEVEVTDNIFDITALKDLIKLK